MSRPSKTSSVMAVALATAVGCSIAASAMDAPPIPQKYKDRGVRASVLCATGAIVYCEPNSTEAKGMLPDINKAWAKEMGLDIKVEGMTWEAVMPSAVSGRTDLVAGISDIESRRRAFNFVDVLYNTFSVIVPVNNPGGVKGWADLCGKKVSAPSASSEQEAIAAADATFCAGAGKPAVVPDLYADQAPTFLAVQAGRAHATLTDKLAARRLLENNPNVYAEAFNFRGNSPWGVAVPANNRELLAVVAYGIKKGLESGSIKAAVSRYGAGDNVVERLMINGKPVD